jgi:hypothetical protein
VISYELWAAAQSRLLEDPGFVGVSISPDDHNTIVLWWLPGHALGRGATETTVALLRTGLHLHHEVTTAKVVDVREEAERLIQQPSEVVAVYVVGPDEHETRLDVTVAAGSFATAAQHGTCVFRELAPRVPITITEGAQPIPA